MILDMKERPSLSRWSSSWQTSTQCPFCSWVSSQGTNLAAFWNHTLIAWPDPLQRVDSGSNVVNCSLTIFMRKLPNGFYLFGVWASAARSTENSLQDSLQHGRCLEESCQMSLWQICPFHTDFSFILCSKLLFTIKLLMGNTRGQNINSCTAPDAHNMMSLTHWLMKVGAFFDFVCRLVLLSVGNLSRNIFDTTSYVNGQSCEIDRLMHAFIVIARSNEVAGNCELFS